MHSGTVTPVRHLHDQSWNSSARRQVVGSPLGLLHARRHGARIQCPVHGGRPQPLSAGSDLGQSCGRLHADGVRRLLRIRRLRAADAGVGAHRRVAAGLRGREHGDPDAGALLFRGRWHRVSGDEDAHRRVLAPISGHDVRRDRDRCCPARWRHRPARRDRGAGIVPPAQGPADRAPRAVERRPRGRVSDVLRGDAGGSHRRLRSERHALHIAHATAPILPAGSVTPERGEVRRSSADDQGAGGGRAAEDRWEAALSARRHRLCSWFSPASKERAHPFPRELARGRHGLRRHAAVVRVHQGRVLVPRSLQLGQLDTVGSLPALLRHPFHLLDGGQGEQCAHPQPRPHRRPGGERIRLRHLREVEFQAAQDQGRRLSGHRRRGVIQRHDARRERPRHDRAPVRIHGRTARRAQAVLQLRLLQVDALPLRLSGRCRPLSAGGRVERARGERERRPDAGAQRLPQLRPLRGLG